MRDEIFDRDYQAGREALNDGIDRLLTAAARTLRVLHAIEFDAPWRHDARPKAAAASAKGGR